MENIKLASGKIVTLESFHITKTYAGLLAGNPSKEVNLEIINNISYPKNWGVRKSYFDKSKVYLSEDILKPFVCTAWLSAEPINDKKKEYDGSSIVIIWLVDDFKGKSIEELIVSDLGKFEWDNIAENFQF